MQSWEIRKEEKRKKNEIFNTQRWEEKKNENKNLTPSFCIEYFVICIQSNYYRFFLFFSLILQRAWKVNFTSNTLGTVKIFFGCLQQTEMQPPRRQFPLA